MDQNEVAQRLAELRERIRAELEVEAPPHLADGARTTGPAALDDYELPPVPGEPALHTTPHLEAANELAVITAPTEIRSDVPLIGPLLSLLRRAARPFVQPILDPYLARQEKFNAEIIRHLNAHGVLVEQRLAAVYAALCERVAQPREIESRLDTALAEYDETLRQRHVVLFDALEEELWAVRGRITEAWQEVHRSLHDFDVRFVQRAQAMDTRFDEKDAALAHLAERLDRIGDLPEKSELLETRTALARALEAVPEGGAEAGKEEHQPFDQPLWRQLREWMSDQDYRAHQDTFRGDEQEITRRLQSHVERFADAPGLVADLGCGRGEFLELLSAADVDAVGVEINEADVDACRAAGYTAEHADLFEWLEARDDESLGGIFLAQVIEHLPPPDWARLFRLAVAKLMPGGRILVETINPESMFAILRAYVLDPTHVRPVHAGLLSFFAGRAGFETVDVHYQAAVPDTARPEQVDGALAGDDRRLAAAIEAVNERLSRLDDLCCQPQEYALVATRRAR
ncbi:MAG: methyltransferase domain-containing protein [Acidobacteria bacterium]|nr:methyltransferase domain-containing protein [Acidobacteriota bacterium]